jgi:phosphoglycerol transferase
MRRLDPRALGLYAGAAALSVVAGIGALQLWRADLRVPFTYGGDALFFSMQVKSIVDNGGWLNNPRLGGPGGLQMHDFPAADTVHLAAVKLMSLFSHDWALIFNLYFLLGFPLITLSALAVFRHFGVARAPAVVGSVLFAFLPSRLLKGEAHIFLDVFFQVPLGMMVVLWICGERPPLVGAAGARGWTRLGLRLDLSSARSRAALLIGAVVGSTGLYYAYFTACLSLAGGVWAAAERRSARHAMAGAAFAAVIALTLGLNGLPTLLYHAREGKNPQVAARYAFEAELYGAKIAPMVLPVDGHRIQMLRRLKERYNGGQPATNEISSTTLGTCGTVGFLLLLGVVVAGRKAARPREDLLRPIAVLNLLAVLFGTVGGFGALVALLITPQLRGYLRINVLIAFLSIFGLVLLLERLERRYARAAALLLPAVLFLGLLDQATPLAVPAYKGIRARYAAEEAFIARVEAAAPPGSLILQLPHVAFPEAPAVNGVETYGQLMPYLHSRSLYWSFPAMKGRAGDAWTSSMAAKPVDQMVAALASFGAGGVLVNRTGYTHGGAEIEPALRQLAGVAPLVSHDGVWAFYGLSALEGRLPAGPSTGDGAGRRDLALHPLLLDWRDGFFEEEHDGDAAFRWCSNDGEIRIDNGAAQARTATLDMTLYVARPPARVVIDGDLISAAFDVPPDGVHLTRTFPIAPGHHVMRIHASGPALRPEHDPRALVFRVYAPSLQEPPAY